MLLHDVFDYAYPEIAEIIGKSEDNVRQLASRARRHVEERRGGWVRFESSREQREKLAQRFLAPVCVDIHTRELEHIGESSERIHLVAAWREAPYFSDGERAALALTEAATRLGTGPSRCQTRSGTKPPASTPSPS